jgi:hypothetical protein
METWPTRGVCLVAPSKNPGLTNSTPGMPSVARIYVYVDSLGRRQSLSRSDSWADRLVLMQAVASALGEA